MNSQMTVHFVIDSLGASGAETSIASLMPALVDRGWKVSASTLYDAGFGDEEALRAHGFDVRPLMGRSFVARVRELRSRLQELQPDVIHTTLFTSDMVGRCASAGLGSAVVSSVVNTSYDPVRMNDPNLSPVKLRMVKILDKLTVRLFVDKLHAVSEGVALASIRDLKLSENDIAVVHRGRDRSRLGENSVSRREAVRERLGIPASQQVVLSAGRQEFQKAHVNLIDAFERLLAHRADVVLLIAGRAGNASSRIEDRLLRSGARDNVVVLGHRRDVPDLLCAADVLVISSLYEGTAGIAIEAMALECPVVSTDLVGVRGILVDRDNALLVPVGDPKAMSEAIDEVLSEPETAKHLALSGRRCFEERFTVGIAADGMVDLYLDAIKRKRSSWMRIA